jgi:hypothetical protein
MMLAAPAMAMPAMAPLDMLLPGGPFEDGEDVPIAWSPLLVMTPAEFVVIVEEAAVDDVELDIEEAAVDDVELDVEKAVVDDVELDVEEVDGERTEERLIELIWQRTKLVVAF